MHSDGGKGSGRRPMAIDDQKFQQQWDSIFGKKKHGTVLAGNEDREVERQRLHKLEDGKAKPDGE